MYSVHQAVSSCPTEATSTHASSTSTSSLALSRTVIFKYSVCCSMLFAYGMRISESLSKAHALIIINEIGLRGPCRPVNAC